MNPHPRRQTGYTLVESLIPVTITAILLGGALPSLQTMTQRRQLEGSAAQLETDLQLARSAAVAANAVLRMDFASGAQGSCYILHDGAAGDCACGADGAPVCSAGVTPQRSVFFPDADPVRLHANVHSIGFDPTKGSVTPTASIRLQAQAGELRLVINVMGRVRSCTPDVALPGHHAC